MGQHPVTKPVSFPNFISFLLVEFDGISAGYVANMQLDPAPVSGAGNADPRAG